MITWACLPIDEFFRIILICSVVSACVASNMSYKRLKFANWIYLHLRAIDTGNEISQSIMIYHGCLDRTSILDEQGDGVILVSDGQSEVSPHTQPTYHICHRGQAEVVMLASPAVMVYKSSIVCHLGQLYGGGSKMGPCSNWYYMSSFQRYSADIS